MSRRIGLALASVLSLVGLGAAADASVIRPEAAPRAWVEYAESATAAITGWLNGAEPPAPGFRAGLLADAPAADRSSASMALRVWVDRTGRLTRVAHPVFADARTSRDLETLLVGKPLGVPPRRMRQPMRLSITVAPVPEQAPPVGDL